MHYILRQDTRVRGREKGARVLNEDDPAVFKMFRDWLYNGGQVTDAPTTYKMKVQPAAAEIQRLENDLRQRFDKHIRHLVSLYVLAEKYSINGLMNRAIDAIQDGFHNYGTVFGPGMSAEIFDSTKESSKLRDLCIAACMLHMDRGCGQLREEILLLSLTRAEFLPHLLRWTAQNFAMFGRRAREGWDVFKRDKGFSILNRAKTCTCLFYTHATGEAHKGHEKCLPKCLDCGHQHDPATVESLSLADDGID